MTTTIEDIQAAYESDLRANRPAVTADDLPLSFDAITDDWLTAVLCQGTPGARVLSHQLGPVDSGSSNRRKIALSYNEAGQAAGLPTGLFCKASHDLANRIVLGVSGAAFTEVHIYNHIRPLLEIEAPRSYFARFDPQSYNSLIMLGDLSPTVTEFCNHKTVMTQERARSQMRLLGRLHGKSCSDPAIQAQLQALPTWREAFQGSENFGIQEWSNKGFLAAEEVIPAALYKRYDEIWPATMRSMDIHIAWPRCLAHGDVHLKNWYVAGNGEMGLSDWQCASRGHWSRDLAYTLATALTVEDRRAWDRELVQVYLDELHANGGPKVSFNDGWNAFRQQLITALTWWTITLTPPPGLPDMQPRDITIEFIRRIATAMDDLGTMDA